MNTWKGKRTLDNERKVMKVRKCYCGKKRKNNGNESHSCMLGGSGVRRIPCDCLNTHQRKLLVM